MSLLSSTSLINRLKKPLDLNVFHYIPIEKQTLIEVSTYYLSHIVQWLRISSIVDGLYTLFTEIVLAVTIDRTKPLPPSQ